MTNTLPTSEPKRILGLRMSALVEMLVGLALLLLLDMLVFHSHRFWGVNPHPFWIVVLMIAAQYGTAEGLVAGIMASLFLLLGNIPAVQEGMSHYDWLFSISLNPVLWIVAGWLLGELRQRHIRERDHLRHELAEAQQREILISDSYNFVKTRKESLEVQVSGQLASSIEAYRAAKEVENLEPKSVMQGVERLVRSVLGAQKFSMFVVNGNKLNATLMHGWEGSDKYQQEIDSFSPLYQSVVGQRELLVIANEQHEIALDNHGLMAAPIIDPTNNQVLGMLKVEQMDFTGISLNSVETFRALCEWIGTALVNARHYQHVKADAVLNPEHNILSFSYFKRQSEYMRHLAKRVNFDLSMLVVKLNNAKTMSDADRITVARQIGESVRTVLRSVDLAFDYQTDGEEYSILLPATNAAGASVVRDKIARDMDQALRGKSVSFNYIVQALHENR